MVLLAPKVTRRARNTSAMPPAPMYLERLYKPRLRTVGILRRLASMTSGSLTEIIAQGWVKIVERQTRCIYGDVEKVSGMMSNAPHNPTAVEVDEPTQPYSRTEIDRLRQVAKLANSPAQEQRLVAERPEVTHVSSPIRGMLTVVPDDTDEDVGDQDMKGWFELDGRTLHVCVRCFEHFGFSGAPPGMIGAVDASFASGTIDRGGSAGFHPRPQRLEIEQAEVEQAPAPELVREDSPPFSRRHKWKLWVLATSPLALALAAWVFTRIAAGPVQSMTRAAEQVEADVPSQLTKVPIEMPSDVPVDVPVVIPIDVPIEAPIDVPGIPGSESDEIPSRDVPLNIPEPRKDFGACVEHRKSAADAKDGGDWARLLEFAQRRRSCWSRVSANALQMEALFELGRYSECVQLGARDGSRKEIRKWLNACQSNL
jgi:hypothetical protein